MISYLKAKAAIPATLATLVHGQAELARGQAAMKEQIETIAKEVRPNGGQSLNDIIQHMAARSRAEHDLNEEAMFEVRVDGGIKWVSRAWQRVMGASLDQSLDNAWFGLIHYNDQDNVLLAWRQSLSQKRDFQQVFRLANGVVVSVHAVCMKVRGNTCVGWHGRVWEGDIWKGAHGHERHR